MPSQNQKILDHLRNRGPITPMDALKLYGCFRLAARINELRRMGIVIKTHKAAGGYAIYSIPWNQTINLGGSNGPS